MINCKEDTIVKPENAQGFIDSLESKQNIVWQKGDHFKPEINPKILYHLEDFLN